jgi:SAM-dependent methyltransferase
MSGNRKENYFAGIAETYDRLQPILVGPAYEEGLKILVSLVPYEQNASFSIVELGCGTAEPTLRLLQKFSGAKALCIDNEPAMLGIARKKLQPFADRSRIEETDITQCVVPPSDLVLSTFVFHHVPPANLGGLLRNIADALHDGGRFILLDQMVVGPKWGQRISEESRRARQKRMDDAISRGEVTQQESDDRWANKKRMKELGLDVEYTRSTDDLLSAMTQNGFDEVGLVWSLFGFAVLIGLTPKK